MEDAIAHKSKMKKSIPFVIDAVRRNWDSPHWWTRQFNARLFSRYYSYTNRLPGDYVPSEDWDNLIILDGCRFDLFKDVINSFDVPGTLEKRNSLGTSSAEFLRENFNKQSHNDTVYISANPYARTELNNESLHSIDHVWLNGWDDEEETVMPETMEERTIETLSQYPNKKIVSHFMQPHHPFVGGVRISSDRGYVGARSKVMDEEVPNWESIWSQLRHGKVSGEEVWSAYQSNLEYVLESVERLIKRLDGLTVITSDHGNAFGERASPFPTTVYGHAPGVRIPALVEVPWFICDSGNRRTIQAEEAEIVEKDIDQELINERLGALGYK